MSKYEIILDQMKYSFSSVNTYDTCHYSFEQNYILIEDRINNFFGNYGSYVHSILESYFRSKIESWDMAIYFQDHYNENIKCSCPVFPAGMAINYYNQGMSYFENFEFDKEKYDIIYIEERIETRYKDINVVVVPDLVLRDKETKEYILIDYKTKNLTKNGKVDKKKMQDVKKQVFLYSYFLWFTKGIEINKIQIWEIRNQQIIEFPYDQFYGFEALEWFETTIEKIKQETEWKANTSQKYFCDEICSNRFSCPYINGNRR
jgi:hypothetical protein